MNGIRPLFIAGPPRSGTGALTHYLNQHEEILICRERYKYVASKINSSFFTFDRILDFEPQQKGGETNANKNYHVKLLAKKDPTKLKWIGDKFPGYVRSLSTISENNPGAHFILTYRPIEEVALSFEARSRNPQDRWLGGRDGFKLGVRHWNKAMRNTCEFIESGVNPHVLILSYHDFFYRNEDFVPLLARFLNLEFDESVRKAWRKMSHEFECNRRQEESLSTEQSALIKKQKDYVAETWVLDYIEEQWREFSISLRSGGESESHRQELAADLEGEEAEARARTVTIMNMERRVNRLSKSLTNNLAQESQEIKLLKRKHQQLKRRVNKLNNKLVKESQRTRLLQRKNRDLRNQISDLRNSRSWKLLAMLGRVRTSLLGSGQNR